MLFSFVSLILNNRNFKDNILFYESEVLTVVDFDIKFENEMNYLYKYHSIVLETLEKRFGNNSDRDVIEEIINYLTTCSVAYLKFMIFFPIFNGLR